MPVSLPDPRHIPRPDSHSDSQSDVHSDSRRESLRADCSNCFGLCCVALSFARSADFALDKPAGDPCVNLDDDFGCVIHPHLRPSGFKGCTVFDCIGAGQKVAQSTYGGVSWTQRPDTRQQMFAVFAVMRELHELLWYLTEAGEFNLPSALGADVDALRRATAEFTELGADELETLDVERHRREVGVALGRASEVVRTRGGTRWEPTRQTRGVGPRADLLGRDLSGASLRRANLRGAVLIAANLASTDLTSVDLLGADLRDARLEGADLSGALFVTQQQVNSARGDGHTRLPYALHRPGFWR
jgi:hypothetical protein